MARFPPSPAFLQAAGLPPWSADLITNHQGHPRAILYNAVIALVSDAAFQGAIRFDEFRGQTMLCAPVPWDQTRILPRPWRDQDDREAAVWLQNASLMVTEAIVSAAVQTVAERNSYHPVKDYLDSIRWDGDPRLDTWLIRYAGASPSAYVEAVGPRWMISGAARIHEPGCRADCVLVLEGPQGILKSTIFAVLGGPFYSNDVAAIGTKDAQEQILGLWIVELDELEAVTRAADFTHVKAFVSRSADRFRLPYGRRSKTHPRQCIFGATTNLEAWHRDTTGGRRWWPAKPGVIRRIDIDLLRQDRDQLWAEARDRYFAQEHWWLDSAELIDEASEVQEALVEQDPWDESIAEHLKGRSEISMKSIFAVLGLKPERQYPAEAKRIAGILRQRGWVRKQIGTGSERVWRYVPKG